MLVVSTTGNGDAPENTERFWRCVLVLSSTGRGYCLVMAGNEYTWGTAVQPYATKSRLPLMPY